MYFFVKNSDIKKDKVCNRKIIRLIHSKVFSLFDLFAKHIFIMLKESCYTSGK